jgi:hypothetical protein
MLEYLDSEIVRPYRVTFADLNRRYLARLGERLKALRLDGELLEDDFEQTRLTKGPALLLATLLLEHIDWQRGVASIRRLSPRWCAIVIQENPPGMTTAVTPGRVVPPSIAAAMATAHAKLVERKELVSAMAAAGYQLQVEEAREVADGKRLVGLLFGA